MKSVTVNAPMEIPQPMYVINCKAYGLWKSWLTLTIKAKLVKWEQFQEIMPLPVSFRGQHPSDDQPSVINGNILVLYSYYSYADDVFFFL